MEKKLSWEEIKELYDQEWVELIDYEWPEEAAHPKAGVVRVHARNLIDWLRLIRQWNLHLSLSGNLR